jgi:hypothetical protein
MTATEVNMRWHYEVEGDTWVPIKPKPSPGPGAFGPLVDRVYDILRERGLLGDQPK